MIDKQKPQEPVSRHASPSDGESPDRRRAQRSGREKGARIIIPAKVLDAAGIDPSGPPPLYELQAVKEEPGRRRRSVLVRLYPA